MQPRQLAPAELVYLVRRHRGGGRRLERPAVELLAVRPRRRCPRRSSRRRAAPRARGSGGRAPARSPARRSSARARPSPPGCSATAARCDSTSDPPRARSARRGASAQRLVEQEGRRNEAGCARRPDAFELAVELPRVRLQPREVRLGVGGVLDAVIAVEEAGDVEIRADVLDDDVRRVAPAADGDVAVGEREALERRRVGAADDFHAGAHGVREAAGVEGRDRARSARSCSATRRCPAAERSASRDRSAARAPTSMPSEVAVSGKRCRRSAMRSSSAMAAASRGAGVGVTGRCPAHAETSGRAAVDARAAIAGGG